MIDSPIPIPLPRPVLLTAAGAPTTPSQIGFPDRLFGEAFTHARELRDRYTFLDFAMDMEP